MHRALRDLPLLGGRMYGMVEALAQERDERAKIRIIGKACTLLVEELRREGLSDSDSDFLLDHAHDVHSRIEDPELGARFIVVT